MLARFAAHRNKVECDNIHLSGLSRCKVVGETKVFAATLLDCLSRKYKPQSFRFFVVPINDQVIAARLTWKISVNQLGLKQLFPDRLGLNLFEFWINGLGQYRFVFFL